MKYIIGTDIGGTAVKTGLFTEAGKLEEKWQIPTDTQNQGKKILPDIAASIEEKLAVKGIKKEDVLGVGIGVPGPVSEDGTVYKCVNLGWDVFNVAEAFEALTGFTTKVGNDANVAALGEVWQGGGRGFWNAVMVTLGTGIGGGIILDGRIIAGAHGAAGEIGHLTMFDDEPDTCGCGKHGCLEQYASATGLVRVTKRVNQAHSGWSKLFDGNFSAKDVCDAARNGDKVALTAINDAMSLLGKGLAQIACTVNPQVFIIGGGLTKSGDLLLNPIKASYQKYAFHACRDTEFKLAELGNDAGIYGAAKMILPHKR